MTNMIPAALHFQLWYKSSVFIALIFQGFIHGNPFFDFRHLLRCFAIKRFAKDPFFDFHDIWRFTEKSSTEKTLKFPL